MARPRMVGRVAEGVTVEGVEGAEVGGVDGGATWERTGGVGAGALVGEDPEIEFGEVGGEIERRGGGGGGGKGFDPERGENVDGVVADKIVRVGGGRGGGGGVLKVVRNGGGGGEGKSGEGTAEVLERRKAAHSCSTAAAAMRSPPRVRDL